MAYKVFYSDYSKDHHLDSQDAHQAGKEDILHRMTSVLRGPKNFIGITDSQGTTLQFYVDAVDEILADIPSPKEQGSYGAKMSLGDCLKLVRELDATIKAEDYPAFQFESWGGS